MKTRTLQSKAPLHPHICQVLSEYTTQMGSYHVHKVISILSIVTLNFDL